MAVGLRGGEGMVGVLCGRWRLMMRLKYIVMELRTASGDFLVLVLLAVDIIGLSD